MRQEIYDYFNTRPRLHTDDDGNITVLGGARRVKPVDMLEVKLLNEAPGSSGETRVRRSLHQFFLRRDLRLEYL